MGTMAIVGPDAMIGFPAGGYNFQTHQCAPDVCGARNAEADAMKLC